MVWVGVGFKRVWMTSSRQASLGSVPATKYSSRGLGQALQVREPVAEQIVTLTKPGGGSNLGWGDSLSKDTMIRFQMEEAPVTPEAM